MPYVGFTTKADQQRREREARKAPSLYIVTRSPRPNKPHYRSAYWFTHAASKAAAVRKAAELLPDTFGPDPYREFNAPKAELVTPGGPASFL
jgi:hypothetical protein